MKSHDLLTLGVVALLGGIVVYNYFGWKKTQKKNYVNVKENQFFTPAMGHFYKK